MNVNQPADVRMVQERLHELGFLATADFLSERADPTATGSIAAAQLARTIAAIRAFQDLVVGRADGNLDPGGGALRRLNDPTYGTLTSFNPEANNPRAGVGFVAGGVALTRTIQAIERAESANLRGEAPAGLVNAAGVPASFGAGQMISGTALAVLRGAAGAPLRAHYGLTMATLDTSRYRAAGTRQRYNAIYGLAPAPGIAEAALQARIAAYITAGGAVSQGDGAI